MSQQVWYSVEDMDLHDFHEIEHMDLVEGRCLKPVWYDPGDAENGPKVVSDGLCGRLAGHKGHHKTVGQTFVVSVYHQVDRQHMFAPYTGRGQFVKVDDFEVTPDDPDEGVEAAASWLCDRVFQWHNMDGGRQSQRRVRSLSVGDVVSVLGQGAWAVDPVGWTLLQHDERDRFPA